SATTTKITMVPGHTNHPRSRLYPPTTTHPDDNKRMSEISVTCFMAKDLRVETCTFELSSSCSYSAFTLPMPMLGNTFKKCRRHLGVVFESNNNARLTRRQISFSCTFSRPADNACVLQEFHPGTAGRDRLAVSI